MDNTIDTSDIEFNINEQFKDGWCVEYSLIVNHIKKNNKLGFLHYSVIMFKDKYVHKDKDGIWRNSNDEYATYQECKILTNMKSDELVDKVKDYMNNGWFPKGELSVEKAVHNNNEYLYFTQMLVRY